MSHRLVWGLAALMFAVTACGGSDDSGGAGAAGSGGGGLGGAGGTTQQPGGSSMDPKCGGSSAGGSMADCSNCMTTKCNSGYQQCLGAGYMTGNYAGGQCEEYMTCVSACDCSDNACYQGCSSKMGTDMSAPCMSCLVGVLGACEVQNCSTECGISTGTGGGGLGGSGGGGGAGCESLAACCAAMASDSPYKSSCDTVVAAGNATGCGSTYDAWKGAGVCQ